MLKMLDEKVKRTPEDIEKEYKYCKYIIVLNDFDNLQDPEGYLYCVSTSQDSFHDICVIAHRLAKDRVPCILMGSYDNWGDFGVQYEYDPS